MGNKTPGGYTNYSSLVISHLPLEGSVTQGFSLDVNPKGLSCEAIPMFKHDPRRRILKPFKKTTFPNGKIFLVMHIPEDKLPFKRVVEIAGKPASVRTRLKKKNGEPRYLDRKPHTLAVFPIVRNDEHFIVYEMNFLPYTASIHVYIVKLNWKNIY